MIERSTQFIWFWIWTVFWLDLTAAGVPAAHCGAVIVGSAKTTKEEASFIQAMENYPPESSEAVRLLYASWLEKRGNPRGQWIRLRVEEARLKASRRWATAARLGEIQNRIYDLVAQAEVLQEDVLLAALPKGRYKFDNFGRVSAVEFKSSPNKRDLERLVKKFPSIQIKFTRRSKPVCSEAQIQVLRAETAVATEDSFVSAIRAQPDNLVLKLDFARWLDAQGDPWGASIRRQLEAYSLYSVAHIIKTLGLPTGQYHFDKTRLISGAEFDHVLSQRELRELVSKIPRIGNIVFSSSRHKKSWAAFIKYDYERETLVYGERGKREADIISSWVRQTEKGIPILFHGDLPIQWSLSSSPDEREIRVTPDRNAMTIDVSIHWVNGGVMGNQDLGERMTNVIVALFDLRGNLVDLKLTDINLEGYEADLGAEAHLQVPHPPEDIYIFRVLGG
ncbi:MAG: hypothetical protein HY537_06190 [Deltaproteobacteria bacterium]|nr:hypothetical protein [Deltaproteobacteria bacterium]